MIFAKAPTPGRVKTRLIPVLGENGAAELQRELIEATLRTAADAGLGAPELWCAPGPDDPLFVDCAEKHNIGLHTQRGGDLGLRMADALESALAAGSPGLLIGCDCPALNPGYLREAAAALAEGNEAVFGPTEDGGYMLIGVAGLAFNLSDHRVSSTKLQRLAQRVVHSQEEERTRVARDLHDGVVQVLVSSKFLLETAQAQLRRLAAQDPATAQRMVDQGLEQLNHALVEIRRVSHGLRPALLDDLGLAPALALMSQQMQAEDGLRMQFGCRGESRFLPPSHATALFRVAQEAVTNAQNHAQATRIDVSLHFQRRRVVLQVSDDGQGFDMRRVQRDRQGGIGLRNMRERIEGLGGHLSISSGARGTRLVAVLYRSGGMPLSPSPEFELPQAAA